MIELFGHPLSSYTWKALIALYEGEIPFRFRVLSEDPEAAEALKALWPIGKFPVLTNEGRTVIESTIIIEHLQLRHPSRLSLVPASPDEALEARQFERIFDNHVMTPMQAIVADALKPPERRDPVAVEEAIAALDLIYGWLDARLPQDGWAVGNAFTIADCAAAPALFYADWVRPFAPSLTRLRSYRRRLLARPSVGRVVDEARPYRSLFPLGAPDRDQRGSDAFSAAGLAHESQELGIEPRRVLPERQMACPVPQRQLGVRHHLRRVLTERGQHRLIVTPMGHEHRQLQALQHLLVGRRPSQHVPPQMGRHHRVEGDHRLEILGRGLAREAGAEECSRAGDLGGEIRRHHARGEGIGGRRRIQGAMRDGVDEVQSGDRSHAVHQKIIAEDPAGVGPSDEHGALQPGRLHHGLEIIAPGLRRLIGLAGLRLAREPMAAKVERHHPERRCEAGVGDLLQPRQMRLAETMHEQDRQAGGIAPFLDGERRPIGRCHDGMLRGTGRTACRRACSRRRRGSLGADFGGGQRRSGADGQRRAAR
jgi:glutathione S-transferase